MRRRAEGLRAICRCQLACFWLEVSNGHLTYVVAILLVQDCSKRLFLGWWVRVVYVRRQWSLREIALWLWAILLANVEHHRLLSNRYACNTGDVQYDSLLVRSCLALRQSRECLRHLQHVSVSSILPYRLIGITQRYFVNMARSLSAGGIELLLSDTEQGTGACMTSHFKKHAYLQASIQ